MSRVYSYEGKTAHDLTPIFAVTGPGLPLCWGLGERHCFKSPDEADRIANLMNRAYEEGQKAKAAEIRAALQCEG